MVEHLSVETGLPWDLGDFVVTVWQRGSEWHYRYRVGDDVDEGVLTDVKPIKSEHAAQAIAIGRLLRQYERGSVALIGWTEREPGVWEARCDLDSPPIQTVVED